MTERCEDLDLFFDRELGVEAEQEFRDHLAACTRCQDVLLGRMLETAVVNDARSSRPSLDPLPADLIIPDAAPDDARPESPGAAAPSSDEPTDLELYRRGRRRLMLVAAVLLPIAAVLTLVLLPHDPAAELTSELAPRRSVDVRFTTAAVDHHRARVVMRAADDGGDRAEPRISLDMLAKLERRHDFHALLAATALRGDLSSAHSAADRLGASAAALSDRAALELLRAGDARDGRVERVPGGARMAAAQRALSLATDALRRQPGLVQAQWNRAAALSVLGLSLIAAQDYDAVAARKEPGWSAEAEQRAAQLRSEQRTAAEDWQRVMRQSDRMIAGGPVLSDDLVARAPSHARDAFYLALATAGTAERIDAVAALGKKLDAEFATTVLGDLVAEVRASDLRARAPLAAELRRLVEQRADPIELVPLRDSALQRGVRDIALASLLAADEYELKADDVDVLDELVFDHRDDWWRAVALERRAYHMEFWRRDYPAVDLIQRRAEPICKALRSRWCTRLTLYAGGANSQMGRADLALEQITRALRDARDARLPRDELAALDQLGQAIAIRVADDIDAAAVSDAYLAEAAGRHGSCQLRLQRLDFAALTALQHHRFDEAAGHRSAADRLEQGECQGSPPRINGETARLRLLLGRRADLATARAQLSRMAASSVEERQFYRQFLAAAATLTEDPARGQAALREVITAADADPKVNYAPVARATAYDVLVESLAAAQDAGAVLGLLAERVGAPRFERCALGVASWNRLVVALLDDRGRPALEARDVPEGTVMIPARDAVPQHLRDRLAGCRRVDVLAAAPYFGAPGLLDDGVAWVYHAGTPRPARGAVTQREVVVSDVTPPDDLRLPTLLPFAGGQGAQLLSRGHATPDNVLAAMKSASLAVVVAHGFTDAVEPTAASLILSPDARGDYLLTASKVRAASFDNAPIVVLAGCDAGRVQVSAEPWSLATSFLAAGARVVVAPTAPIPDDEANEVFQALIGRIRRGEDPAEALVAERHGKKRATWLSSVVLFE